MEFQKPPDRIERISQEMNPYVTAIGIPVGSVSLLADGATDIMAYRATGNPSFIWTGAAKLVSGLTLGIYFIKALRESR
ncbi:MAG: hypothetical protein HYW26_01310 [Candidatus Aenigmarchaeota archaeon]|nr:hypothetical protein [Candidatus Aenigmarchaeota archaeon]